MTFLANAKLAACCVLPVLGVAVWLAAWLYAEMEKQP